jgi:enamine deaminase RidA (YjgF/YER057c/UK114 family)
MLTLSYVPASGAAPLELAAIAFGADAGAEAFGVATPVLAPASPGLLVERWATAGPLSAGRHGALAYRHDAGLLFGAIRLAESDADLQTNTAAAYRQIFATLDALGFPHLWRVWNFIPHINAEAAGLERYRRFNVARQEAFAAAGRATLAAVPAASAVGCAEGELVIYFMAGRAAPLPIENPRQLSAYDYPPEYGPRSPLFARACLAPLAHGPQGNGELLFVSGTASIVGHRTLHAGDVRAQTRESLANIDAVLAAANARAQTRRFARGDLAYKVYVRHAADLAAIQDELDAWLPAAAAIYLQADICRADLLVEIEASGGHAMSGL